MPEHPAGSSSDIEAMRRDGYVCQSCHTRVWPAPSSAPQSVEPPFDELLSAFESAVFQNGRVHGADSYSVYHEMENADDATPREAIQAFAAALTADRDRLARRVEALEADAERWRYLRQFCKPNPWTLSPATTLTVHSFKVPPIEGRSDATVEEIVDAARAALTPPETPR
jgi:hypothetical protein